MTEPLILTAVVTDQIVDVTVPPLPAVNVTTDPGQPLAVVTVEGPGGPRGQPGTNARVTGEVPVGVQDGGNAVFTLLNNYVADSTAVYRNGVRGLRGYDYDEWAPNQISFSDAPLDDDVISVDYLIT